MRNDSKVQPGPGTLTPSTLVSSGRSVDPEGERRQITVMYYAMAVSSAGSAEVDPEDLGEMARAFQEVCGAVLGHAGGPVSQAMGDGTLVYFGFPVAHGGDAQQAISAGLEIVDAAARLDARMRRDLGVGLSARVGIHTGLVVTGDVVARSDSRGIMGQAPSIAIQLESVAEPFTVVVSASTRALIKAHFVCEPLASRMLKGATAATEIFRVSAERGAEELDEPHPVEASPIVGRDAEIGLLTDRWEQVKSGAGQVMLILGEAGIGKSRLVKAFKESLRAESFQWLECQCSPYFESSALNPIIDLVLRVARIGRGDPAPLQRLKLEQLLAANTQPLDALPLLASLLSVPISGVAPLNLSPQRQKQRTHEALLALFRQLGAKEPLCLVVQDLHWVDPSTLELLGSLVDQAPAMGLLTILTSRLEFRPPWTAGAHFTPMTVTRLPRKRVEAMILTLTRGKALPAEVLDQLVTRTDGVPLFVEELTKAVLESGLLEDAGTHYTLGGPMPAPAIPATLRDSLTARLDRLGKEKGTAQLAAIFGRQFSYEALRSLSPLDEETLRAELARLVELEIIYSRGLPPRATYTFKHALVQDAAYESLLKNKRRQGHQRVADTLRDRSPEIAESQPELLAHHYAAAGVGATAARYLLRAGQKAIERSADAESLSHLGKALSLVEAMPEGSERDRLELTLRTVIGVPLMATKGYGAVEVEQTYARALALGKNVDGAEGHLPVLWGLWIFYHVRGKYLTAYGLAEQLMRIAEGSRDSSVHLCAHLALGATSLLCGKLGPAREHLERCIALYDPAEHRAHAYLYGQDPGMFSRVMLAWDLWVIGYPDAAIRTAEDAVRLAEGASHPNTLGFALGMIAMIHQYRREVEPARRRSAEVIALSNEQGLAHWAELGHMVHGWALKEQGQRAEGLDEMRVGLATWRRIGARVVNTHWASELALACAEAGEIEESLRLLREAKAFMIENGERWFEPELVRIEGEIVLAGSRDAEAAADHFLRAIHLASRAGARTLELRAALSLARLWRGQPREGEARAALARIHAWFTEGFDTRDIEEARGLLTE